MKICAGDWINTSKHAYISGATPESLATFASKHPCTCWWCAYTRTGLSLYRSSCMHASVVSEHVYQTPHHDDRWIWVVCKQLITGRQAASLITELRKFQCCKWNGNLVMHIRFWVQPHAPRTPNSTGTVQQLGHNILRTVLACTCTLFLLSLLPVAAE